MSDSVAIDSVDATRREGLNIEKVRAFLTLGANAYHYIQIFNTLRAELLLTYDRAPSLAGHIKSGARELFIWTESLDVVKVPAD